MNNPTIGIIYARDGHPAAKRLDDLTDEDRAGQVLCSEHLPLDAALERVWEQDAHLITYRVDADAESKEYAFARLSKKSPFVQQLEQAGGRVRVTALVFDHDLPKSHGGEKQEWSADSLEEFLQVLQNAVGTSIPEPTTWYSTLHGSRFVYVLQEEVSQLDAEAMMRGIIAQFAKAGIELDEACQDWTRLFRLPNTVREDSGVAYVSQILSGGPALDPSTVDHIASMSVGDTFAETDLFVGEMPDPDECKALLEYTGENGRKYKTELIKTAKRQLAGRDSYGIVFEQKPLVQGNDGWNNQVFKVIGQIIGMMAREETSTPEGIYALLHSATEQLQDREMRGANETNWYEVVWDDVCRVWSNETSQIAAEREDHERRAAEANVQRTELIEEIKEARPEIVPEDPEQAKEWFKRQMIASDGRRHHIMLPDGSYNIRPVTDSLLIPMILELGMQDLIQTTEYRGKVPAQRSSTAIINDHATPITAIECSVREEVAYIDGSPGRKVLHIPVHSLNPKLTPGGVFDDRVDRWLKALGGKSYDQLTEWLAHSLDVRRAICALNLYGSPGTGKGMLAAGLAECFDGEQRNDGRALGKFNLGLLDSPIVNCDEGVPKISSDEALTVDQAFRSLVTGGRITIRAMHRDPFNADIYPRILFTSNDRDIIRSIVGHRDLTSDDIQAIELRLLSIQVCDDAQLLLTRNGNYAFTKGWVAGQRRSEYTLANHILYLYENRTKSQTSSGRLLVEGETRTALVQEMRLRSKGAQTVLRSLVSMIESPGTRRGLHVYEMRVWVQPAAIVNYTEATFPNLDITLPVAGRVLRQFSVGSHDERKLDKSNPPGTTREQRGRWIEIDLGIIFEEGMRYGIQLDRTHKLLSQQPGGPEKIAAVESTQE